MNASLIARRAGLACVLLLAPIAISAHASNITLPPETPAILDKIYSFDLQGAVEAAKQMQQERPNHPLGYLLEAEALWWRIRGNAILRRLGGSILRTSLRTARRKSQRRTRRSARTRTSPPCQISGCGTRRRRPGPGSLQLLCGHAQWHRQGLALFHGHPRRIKARRSAPARTCHRAGCSHLKRRALLSRAEPPSLRSAV